MDALEKASRLVVARLLAICPMRFHSSFRTDLARAAATTSNGGEALRLAALPDRLVGHCERRRLLQATWILADIWIRAGGMALARSRASGAVAIGLMAKLRAVRISLRPRRPLLGCSEPATALAISQELGLPCS